MWPQLMTGDGSQPRTVPICIETDQKAIFFHPTKTHQISPTFVRQDLCGRTARMSSGRGGRGQWGDPESSQMKATEHFFGALGISMIIPVYMGRVTFVVRLFRLGDILTRIW